MPVSVAILMTNLRKMYVRKPILTIVIGFFFAATVLYTLGVGVPAGRYHSDISFFRLISS